MALARRAPFAGHWVSLMAEHFATTADVYRLTGDLPEHADMLPSADHGAKNVAASARRLARMLGLDMEAADLPDLGDDHALAAWIEAHPKVLERPIVIDEDSGKTFTAKVPSTPQDSSIGVLNGVARICEESGVDPAELPANTTDFGVGWWKYDVEEAGKLLESVGFTKNADGNWLLPSGEEWVVQLTIPGDWNKVMQRTGFAVADSWRAAGIQVNVQQVEKCSPRKHDGSGPGKHHSDGHA